MGCLFCKYQYIQTYNILSISLPVPDQTTDVIEAVKIEPELDLTEQKRGLNFRFKCKFCEKAFTRAGTLKSHITKVHEDENAISSI